MSHVSVDFSDAAKVKSGLELELRLELLLRMGMRIRIGLVFGLRLWFGQSLGVRVRLVSGQDIELGLGLG